MGAVYKAKKLDTGEFVALKILLPSLATEEYIARFRRETEIVRKLDHENIVKCVDFGRDETRDFHFCALEFVQGEDLDARVSRTGALAEDEALSITYQVAEALQHAYLNGLIHRDIKPENIMVTPDGTVKLLDLGLARPAGQEVTRLTQSGIFVGTPHYASPEQAKSAKEIDIRSDIYSLGATLYHMVTGTPPFDGETALVVLQKHVYEKLPWPAEINPLLSDDVCLVVTKMMAKDPADRYQMPKDLLRDLDQLKVGRTPEVAEHAMKTSSIDVGSKLSQPPPPSRGRLDTAHERTSRPPTRGGLRPVEPRRRRETQYLAVAAARRERSWLPTAVAAGAGGVVILLAFVFMMKTGGESEREWAPFPPPVSPEARAPARTVADAFREAEEYERQHKQDVAGAIAKYEAVVRDFPGTIEAEKAKVNVIWLGTRLARPEVKPETPVARRPDIPPDAVSFGGHRYKLYGWQMSWDHAKRFCEEKGGHLVTITSKGEDKFLTNLVRRAGVKAWMGFTDEGHEGRWEWVTGEKVAFTAWSTGEPNNLEGKQHWALLTPTHGYRWIDYSGERGFICEWEAGVHAARTPAARIDLTRGLVGHWKFDEGRGTIARDSSGKGSHGRIHGARWAKGKIGGALDFHGQEHCVEVDLTLDGLTTMTIAAWINPRTAGHDNFGRIVYKGAKGTPSFQLRSNKLDFEYDFSGASPYWHSASDEIVFSQWQHVAVTYDNSSTANDPLLYVSGSSVAITQSGTPAGSPWADDNKLWIGNRCDLSRAFDGLIDDVRIYDRALSAEEIKALASQSIPRSHPGEAWRTIFNGRDMTGWKHYDGDGKAYVEDGALASTNDADL